MPTPAPVYPEVVGTTLSTHFPDGYVIHPDFVAQYDVKEELGAGGCAFVLLAQRRHDAQDVAVKFISKRTDRQSPFYSWVDHEKYGRVPHDVEVMDRLDHENIVALLDVFSDDQYVYIVSPVVFSSPSRALKRICRYKSCTVICGCPVTRSTESQLPGDVVRWRPVSGQEG